jgi:hypothetical protein
MRRLVLVALGLVACTGVSPGSEPAPPLLDQAAYVRDVHAILETRCATLDCHGNVDRPFRLYAETGLRATDALRDTPITGAELAADVAAASGLDDPAQVDDNLILLKALGKMKHSGQTVWSGTDEPQYLCVRGWLAGASDGPEVAAACAEAAVEVALPPP